MSEPLLRDDPNRFCLYPIQYQDIWKAYKDHQNGLWRAEEIDFGADKNDWANLSKDERYFVEHILAFFAGSDGIVLENLVKNFCQEITVPEARCFYAFQAAMENIHCCAGDTETLTDGGWRRLDDLVAEGQVNVWNGLEFTPVHVQFTGRQPLHRVHLSIRGVYLDATPDHTWYLLVDGKEVRVKTTQLLVGDHIFPYTLPPVTQGVESGFEALRQIQTDTSAVYVTRIETKEGEHPTYCFYEPKRNRGVFNGVLTGQSEVYSLMIDTYVQDPERKLHLFQATSEIPCIKKKADWALKWIHPEQNYGVRLFAFGIVEGLFFSGSFCAIFWLKERGLMIHALGKSNEWIARDESLHTEFAILLFTRYVQNKPSTEEAHAMMQEAVLIEEEFICESLPVSLIGMNSDLMRTYVRFVGDRLLTQFGYPKIFGVENPFSFMEKISLDGKTNFFEQRVSEYSLNNKATSDEKLFDMDGLEHDDF